MNTKKQAHNIAIKAIYLSIAGNTFLAVVKWLAGFFGNSHALIADAIESTSDVFSSMLVWFGLRYANKPADTNHPYGHGRAEPLITFLIVGFLIISAVSIAYMSVQNIRTPHALPKPYTLIIVGAIILYKEIFYRVTLARSKQTGSSSLKADAWHHRSDAITSLAAFIGITAALLLGAGYEAADDWAALFASGFILYNAFKIFRPALGEIMDENLYHELVEHIRQVTQTVSGVVDTEKCLVRKAGLKYHVDLHVIVAASNSVRKGHDIAHEVKRTLKEQLPEIADVLIHIEPDN